MGNPGFLGDFIRGFFSMLDSVGYFFLSGIFDIFFTVVNAEIFQGDILNTFYTRIQLILGIFMTFRISITLLQIIVNPDMFKDKQKGAGSLVMRIVVMLIMLTLVAPITIPKNAIENNPLNEKIASNGILFGFLYQFQNSVVEDNILGKLILGSKTDSTTQSGAQLPGMSAIGDVLTADIARSFIIPTRNDGYENVEITETNYEEALACPTEVRPYFERKGLTCKSIT